MKKKYSAFEEMLSDNQEALATFKKEVAKRMKKLDAQIARQAKKQKKK